MITWVDEAVLLSARPHAETSAIVEVFSLAHGRHAGVVRGGTGRKLSPVLQPGAQVQVTWKARLDSHLGSFTVEPLRSRSAVAMSDRLALAGLNAICALLSHVLPEREPHEPLYHRTTQLLDLLGQTEIWPLGYLRWELALLSELGFALDLDSCAVTGATDGLVYISPKSGRAVSAEGAGDWADRLLPLPPVLSGHGAASNAEITKALGTTGYFIEHRLMDGLGNKPMPVARGRLIDAIARTGDR